MEDDFDHPLPFNSTNIDTVQHPPPSSPTDSPAPLTVPPLLFDTPLLTTPPRVFAQHLPSSLTIPHPPPPPTPTGTSNPSLPPPPNSPSHATSGTQQAPSTKTTHTARRARPQQRPHPPLPQPAPSSSSIADEPERPNRNLRHADKRRICEISDKNPTATQHDLVDIFYAETGRRVERSTISRIIRKKTLWKRAGATDAKRKRFGPPRYPAVEAALFELIRHRSRDEVIRRTLSDDELLTLAKRIAGAIVEHMPSDSKASQTYAPLLRSFCGSRTWLMYFKKRWALSSKEESNRLSVVDIQTGKLRLSEDHLRDSFNIWPNRLNIADTVELISNWSRMEDLYVLDALVLSTDALPDHTKKVMSQNARRLPSTPEPSTGGSSDAQDVFRNEAMNETDNNNAELSDVDASIPGPPSISVSNAADYETVRSAGEEGSSVQGTESCSEALPGALFMFEGEEVIVDDDNVVTLLVGTNATGHDLKAPWMVGKVPIGKLGSREGEVWRDCSVRYFHNSRGWLSASIIHGWVKEFDESLDRSVLLVSSLFSMCDLELLDLKYVTLLPVPRTELAQAKSAALELSNMSNSPVHLGIEQSFRARYRSLVVERALKFMTRRQQIPSPSLEASGRMIEKAWRKVTSSDVRRAWHSVKYVPMRFRRLSRVRVPIQHKQGYIDELKRLLLRYRQAVEEYSTLENVEVDRDGVQCSIDDLCEYIWLSREPALFHPHGTVLDFARAAIQENTYEDFGESLNSKGSKFKVFPAVESAGEALEAANQLAQFVRKQADKIPEDVIQWIGGVQLVMKRLRDEKRNEDIEKEWGSVPSKSRMT